MLIFIETGILPVNGSNLHTPVLIPNTVQKKSKHCSSHFDINEIYSEPTQKTLTNDDDDGDDA